jgi:hypothetical protein
MDPATLAAATVGLLAPFLGKIGDAGLARVGDSLTAAATEHLGRLYQAIKKKLAGDPYHDAILRGAEERPDSQPRLSALEGILSGSLAEDPGFAAAVAGLFDQATAAGARTIQVTGSGAVAGGDASMTGRYVAGRDMRIGRETPDEDG